MSKQKDKCPECDGRGELYDRPQGVNYDCPTCNGTGEKKLEDKLIPEELEKARAYLKSELGYDLNYEQVRDVVKAYLQIRARRKSNG